MRIEFANSKLLRLYADSRAAAKRLGPDVALRFIATIDALTTVANFSEVQAVRRWRCHLLEPAARNYWSLTLTERWRLIVAPSEDGQVLTVEAVSHHYGD